MAFVTYLVVKCVIFEFKSFFLRINLENSFIAPIFAAILHHFLIALLANYTY